jgi:error-prone DNA polymerase
MVHPYLKRRDGVEKVTYPAPAPEHGPDDELETVLKKTMGVPLFQEQAMNLAMTAAKFTPEEANGLRRSMATFRNLGTIGTFGEKFVSRMIERGYDPAFAQACFEQIKGFGSYGFPESHAVSFAKLVYVSAWIKCFYPDVFLAAMLNSQPMGFYQPAQLVRDAKDHGVTVLAPDILLSDWDSKLEAGSPTLAASPPVPPHEGEGGIELKAVRLGLHQIAGMKEDEGRAIMVARQAGARTLEAIAVRAGLSRRCLELLAEADALRSLGMDRREGLWAVKGLAPEVKASVDAPLLALMGPLDEAAADLPVMSLPAHVHEDYRTVGLSLKAHPCQFFRPRLDRMGVTPADRLKSMRNGQRVSVGGLVLVRQRPGTAKGVIFLTLEDETGPANAVVWADVFAANRRQVMSSGFLVVHGRLQVASDVIHVVAERFTDLSRHLGELKQEAAMPAERLPVTAAPQMLRSRDFH